MKHMKHMKLMAIGTFFLLGASVASAQSLGDYARAVRKNKVEPSSATRHYDNDNLPTGGELSVVGPPPASGDKAEQDAENAKSTDAADRQKAADDLKQKIARQKEKMDSLSRELDLEQREYRLRAAAFYGDAGDRLRNSAQWDKDDAQYKNDIDSKQKAIEAARQEFDDLQEQARKAGIPENEQANDKDSSKNNDDSKDKDKDKDKQ